MVGKYLCVEMVYSILYSVYSEQYTVCTAYVKQEEGYIFYCTAPFCRIFRLQLAIAAYRSVRYFK